LILAATGTDRLMDFDVYDRRAYLFDGAGYCAGVGVEEMILGVGGRDRRRGRVWFNGREKFHGVVPRHGVMDELTGREDSGGDVPMRPFSAKRGSDGAAGGKQIPRCARNDKALKCIFERRSGRW